MEKDYLLIFDSVGLNTRDSDPVVFTRNPFIMEEELAESISGLRVLPYQFEITSSPRCTLPAVWNYNHKGFEQALFMLTYLREYWVTPVEFCCNQYGSDWMFDSLIQNVKNIERPMQQITLIKLSQLCSARLRPLGPLLLDKLGLGSKQAAKIAAIMVLLGIDFGLISSFLRQSIIQNIFRRIEHSEYYLNGSHKKIDFPQAVALELINVSNGDEKYSIDKVSELYRAYQDYRKFFHVVSTFDANPTFKYYSDLDRGFEFVKYINSESIFSFNADKKKNAMWLELVVRVLGKSGYYTLPMNK